MSLSIMSSMRQRSHKYPATTYGVLTDILPVMQGKRLARFLTKIETPAFGCHLWRGNTNNAGYGLVQGSIDYLGYTFLAHRVVWALDHRREPGELIIRHRCDTPRCCNKLHLLSGDHLDNARDMIERGRAPDYSTFAGRPRDLNGGQEAKRLRFEEGWTIAEIAQHLDRHRTTIMRWIND